MHEIIYINNIGNNINIKHKINQENRRDEGLGKMQTYKITTDST